MNILDLDNDNSGFVFSAKLQQGRWDAHLHQGEILRRGTVAGNDPYTIYNHIYIYIHILVLMYNDVVLHTIDVFFKYIW